MIISDILHTVTATANEFYVQFNNMGANFEF